MELLTVIVSLYLLYLRCGGSEQLDVPGPDNVFVLQQSLVSLSLLLEQDEGVSSCSAVRLLDEENSVLLVQDLTGLLPSVEEVDLRRED